MREIQDFFLEFFRPAAERYTLETLETTYHR